MLHSQSFHYRAPAGGAKSPYASSVPSMGLDTEQPLSKGSPGERPCEGTGMQGTFDEHRGKG